MANDDATLMSTQVIRDSRGVEQTIKWYKATVTDASADLTVVAADDNLHSGIVAFLGTPDADWLLTLKSGSSLAVPLNFLGESGPFIRPGAPFFFSLLEEALKFRCSVTFDHFLIGVVQWPFNDSIPVF